MVSIFKSLADETFWHRSFIEVQKPQPTPICSGTLTKKTGKGLKSNYYELHPFQLLTKNPVKGTCKILDLSFRTFKPFVDSSDTQSLYGFSIDSQDFFVPSSSDLDKWVASLQPMCILTDLDQDFIKLKEIGHGSTSKVFLATSTTSSKQFAIKSMTKSKISSSPSGLRNLYSEISILQLTDHENIIKLFFVYESDTTVDLVFDYLCKDNLCERMKKIGSLDEETGKNFMIQLLQALDYLHSQDLVHRDLKLENIILCNDWGLDFKIVDFGLGFETIAEGSCGSPGYVAPEVIAGQRYDSKIDIFSAGVILFILLCGKHPFAGRTEKKIMENNSRVKFEMSKKLSPEAKEVIFCMLQKNPKDRKSARELMDLSWFSCMNKDCFSAFVTS
jgi:serine/threonine protein kinase